MGQKDSFNVRHINLKRGECRFRKVPDGEKRLKAERSDEAGVEGRFAGYERQVHISRAPAQDSGVERGLMYLLDTNILLELLLN